MRRRFLRSLRVPAVIGGFLFPALSGAAEENRLRYEAPEGCSSEADFVAAVTSRGGNFAPSRPEDAAATMVVSIRKSDEGYDGSLQVESAANASSPRVVHGATCAEVTDALAVVTAIALQPHAPAPPTVATVSAAPPAPAAAPPPAEPEKRRLRAGGDVGTKAVEVSAGTLHFDKVTGVTAFAGLTVGMLPSTILPRYDLSVSRVNFVTTPDGNTYLEAPIVRLRSSLLGEATVRSRGYTTEIVGVSEGLSTCVSPFYDTRGLAVLGCFEFAASVMSLHTKNAAGAQTQTKTVGFGTGGIGAETTYNLGDHFQFGLKLGLDFMLSQFAAEDPDGKQLFHSSTFTGYGMLGFGGHW